MHVVLERSITLTRVSILQGARYNLQANEGEKLKKGITTKVLVLFSYNSNITKIVHVAKDRRIFFLACKKLWTPGSNDSPCI